MLDDPKIIPFPTTPHPEEAVATLLPTDSPIHGSLQPDDEGAPFKWGPTLIVSAVVVALMAAIALL